MPSSRHSAYEPAADTPLRPSAVLLWATIAVVVTVGLTASLVALSDGADPRRLSGLLDILRIGLSVGAGTGGLFALWLATRRQRSAERTLSLQREVARTTVTDNTERRITEQYNSAIEQLGHEKAAVRLGAIYSLERLAQEHPEHRQTVVDVFCSYLRLPYEPPDNRRQRTGFGVNLTSEAVEALAELEVRYTIQGMLWEHLADPEKRDVGERRWSEIDLDLSRTILTEPILRYISVRTLTFQHAIVHGYADFGGIRVSGISVFQDVHFTDKAIFSGAVFGGGASLVGCTFDAGADFSETSSSGIFTLLECHIRGECDLSGQSAGCIIFRGCQFERGLTLRSGVSDVAIFLQCGFHGPVHLEGLEVPHGLFEGCSFEVSPDYHPRIVSVDDISDSDGFMESLANHFGFEVIRRMNQNGEEVTLLKDRNSDGR